MRAYVALANAIQEAKFLRRLCMDMRVSAAGKLLIMIDNQGVMNLSRNPVHHQRSKHIDIKSEVQESRINLEYVPSEENVS